ncbi:PIG-L deacetylase family protein [Stenotrophomonas sp. 22385]|jgi:LmbE family N-acetylglucosaminyl deacetylase|uniref:PIG-L deacetylase family protein n=1 Tax=Stenotrophomonas sp. 22385 TaxID=3453915 RepID=UPI003F863D49
MDAVAVRIEGQGTPESAWQGCAWLEALPSVEADTVLLGARRLIVVSPHPDDEVLGCGGLMQAAAAQGCAVQVISVTDGEACYPDHPRLTPARLRDARRRELAVALQALGMDATHVTSLGLPDGAVARHETDLAAHLGARLSAGDVVLAPWIHDAHPDHEAAGRAARAAAASCGARSLQYPVWAWHWLDAQAPAGPWTSAQRIALCPAARARKREAIAAFATQTGEGEALGCEPILPEHVLDRFRRSFEVLIG